MSNTIGSAVIEVGVDTKGVDSGFAKIDGAVTKTGKTLESLGGKATKGFGDIGAGGDSSAKKVEQATKNMIGSIQRTTASLESGTKTSAKYYETLANQRGVNIEALRPYLAQLDAVKAKQEAAAKAAEAAAKSTAQIGAAASKITAPIQTAGASILSFGKSFLLGAAVGLSYDALKGKITGVIDSMANLKTLSEKTGSSVENLSKLAFAAKQSGSDVDSVGNALAKLAKGMAGADADSKGAGLALKFLGLQAKDAAGNLKDPATMFTEIAKKLVLYQDGAGKVAIAQALLGKSGAEMLPTLKLVAEQGDIAAKVTDAQATAARQYNRDMAKLNAQQGLLYKTIATAVLPTMTDFANVLLDASKNANQVNGAVKGLADDNSLADWADSAAMGLARVVDVIKLIPLTLKSIKSSFEVVFADLTVLVAGIKATNPAIIASELAKGQNPFADFKTTLEARNKTLADANRNYQQLWDADGNATERKMAAAIAKRKAAQATLDASAPKPKLLEANFDTSGEDGKAAEKAAAAAKKQAEENAISKVGDDLAQFSVAGLAEYTKVGEGYLETLTRVANDSIQVNDVLAVLGKSFNATGLGAVKLSEGLILAAGDLETLTTNTSYFVENFLSESERMAPIVKSVQTALGALGVQNVTTVDQFKDMVLAQDLSTTAGQTMYAALIALAPQFKAAADYTADLATATGQYTAVVKSAADIASEHKDLQSQLNDLTLTDVQLLALQRDGIADVNKSLFDQVQLAKKVADGKTALATAYTTESTAMQAAIDKTKSFATSLRTFTDGLALGSSSTLTPEQQYAEAQKQFESTLAAAKGGDATAQSGLQAAETALLAASKVVNASDSQYAADYARVVNANEEAIKWASTQVDVQQASLDALTKLVSGYVTINDSINSSALTVVQAIQNLTLLGYTGINGSHAGGLVSTPYDGYIAELHAGEPVIDAPAAAALRRYFGGTGPSSGGASNTALVAEIKALRAEVAGLRADQQQQTGDLVVATYDANDRNAAAVNAGTADATNRKIRSEKVTALA